MTELIYYKDKKEGNFTATVISCEKTDKGYKVLLTRTAFFPEQGGQHCDSGTINGLPVLHVSMENEDVYHYVPEEIPAGSEVSGRVDMLKRFDLMQNHSGEHILSGIMHRKYGFNNVGFHLSETEMTLDTDGFMTEEMIAETEEEANKAVWANLPVTVIYPKPGEEIPDYRSKKEIYGSLRLVKIGDIDLCACCALHVSQTGEIGQIRIIKSMKYKGGSRLTVVCGKRAYLDAKERFNQTERIGELLSVPFSGVSKAVEDLADKNGKLKYELQNERKNEIKNMVLREKEGNNDLFFAMESPWKDKDIIQEGALYAAEVFTGNVFIYAGSDDTGYNFVLLMNDGDIKAMKERLAADLKAKCGGKDKMLSGRVACTKKDIQSFFDVYGR